MKGFKYLPEVSTLTLDEQCCVGCGQCESVCPHRVFRLEGEKSRIIHRDGCMECGACAVNCPAAAITLEPGVGCAAYIVKKWLQKWGIGDGEIECC